MKPMLNLNSPIVLGFLKGLGVAILGTVLSYLANATNLQGLVNPMVAALIAAIALGLHDHIESKTGNLLFGAIKRS